jgi:hypothetical protein
METLMTPVNKNHINRDEWIIFDGLVLENNSKHVVIAASDGSDGVIALNSDDCLLNHDCVYLRRGCKVQLKTQPSIRFSYSDPQFPNCDNCGKYCIVKDTMCLGKVEICCHFSCCIGSCRIFWNCCNSK